MRVGRAQDVSAPIDNVAALTVFPYCVCDDYRCSSNPYRLVMLPRETNGAEYNLCYRIDLVRAPWNSRML
jgi:hypothetical protein